MGKRPGFRREKPLYRLRFEDDELQGLEVMAKSVPLREFIEQAKLEQRAKEGDPDAFEGILRHMAGVLVSWNLEDEEGNEIPCTYDGLLTQDLGFVIDISQAYQQAVAGVPKSSLNGSNGGGTFPERSIQMEVS